VQVKVRVLEGKEWAFCVGVGGRNRESWSLLLPLCSLISRPAKQPGLNFLVKGIQFLISVPGGSETSVERTNLGNETLGPVRGLNLVPPGAHDGWMQGAVTIAMPLRIGEELERSRQASSAPALRVVILSNQLCVVRCHRYLYRLRLTPWSDSIAQATEPNSVPGLDPGIGPDVHHLRWDVRF